VPWNEVLGEGGGRLPLVRRVRPQYTSPVLQLAASTKELLLARARAKRVVSCMLSVGMELSRS